MVEKDTLKIWQGNIKVGDKVWVLNKTTPLEAKVFGTLTEITETFKLTNISIVINGLLENFNYFFPTLDALLADLRSRAVRLEGKE